MKGGAAAGIVAAVIALGGAMAFSGGGSSTSTKKKGPKRVGRPKGPGEVQGIAMPAPGDSLVVGLGCKVEINDVERAKARAYAVGKAAATLDAAQLALYKFGACGRTEPLIPAKPQMRDLYMVNFELYRGCIKGGALTRPRGRQLLRAAQLQLSLAGVSTADLPTDFLGGS